LRARGAVSVNLDWKDGKLTQLVLTAQKTGTFTIRYGKETRSVKLTAGEPQTLEF
jgi:hypothetical protein